MTHREEITDSSRNKADKADGAAVAPEGAAPDSLLPRITLRSTGELADALPYLLGHRPEDSMVLVALHDSGKQGRFGGRARLGIPAEPANWQAAAGQLARGLVTGSARRGSTVTGMVAYVCQEPGPGETGREVMERLRPLAQLMRTECGRLDVPVVEALCLSGGRYWSYCCSDQACCPAEGRPMGLPGTSVLAAASAFAGIRVRGSLEEVRVRLRPWEGTSAVAAQEAALDATAAALLPRLVVTDGRAQVEEQTMELAERVHERFAGVQPEADALDADLRDDRLLSHEEAATLVHGLQDRVTRDRAAEWMEGEDAAPALRLWRALSRRCVGSYGEHAAPLLTLAGWVAWSTGDDVEAREALAMALAADPAHLFARLLHRAIDEGLDPESVRRCLRAERARRTAAKSSAARPAADASPLVSGEAEVDGPPPLSGEAEVPGEADGDRVPEGEARGACSAGDTAPAGSPEGAVGASDGTGTTGPSGDAGTEGASGGAGTAASGSAGPAASESEGAGCAGPGGAAGTVAVGGVERRSASCRVPARLRTGVNRRGPGRADPRLSRPGKGGGPVGGPGLRGRAHDGRRRGNR
ncbi:DUF4192 domain-containing protein [Streptomyces fragilis]|uniref:DUF4192 domain-containing protein n=1 Tax=Streptomyces fragilis TaxID=67301 RepID=UPI0024DE4D2A|nr:DUF4192 domain-containing protein [Streptomyces fragilis]